MKYIVATLIVVVAVGACIISIVSASSSGDSHVQIVPLGLVISPDGTVKYEVGLTNQTSYTLECIVSPAKVVTASDGTISTNFFAMGRVVLEPRAGTQIAITPPREPSWTLMAAHRRLLSNTGAYFRGLGSRVGLCQFVIERQMTSIEIDK